MSYTVPVPMPRGLLEHLSSGAEGYDALCSLLGIATTQQKKEIINLDAVKKRLAKNPDVPRRGRQADRLRASLLALYGDPDARREIWRHHYGLRGERDHYTVPSLEREALTGYAEDILTAQPATDALADCQGFFSSSVTREDWRAPALAALPRLKAELASWSSVASERRPRVALAAFAVATLLEDARFLVWAMASDPDLADRFGSLDLAVPDSEVESSGANSRADRALDDTLAQLRERATALAEAARGLIDGPATEGLFDAVEVGSRNILHLRAPVLALVADTNALRGLHAELADSLAEKAKTAPWLAGELERCLTSWRDVYPATVGTSLDAFRADVARVASAVDPALAEVARTEMAFRTAQAASEEHRAAGLAAGAQSLADYRREAELSADVAQTRKQVVEAMEQAVRVMEPHPLSGGNGGLDEAPDPNAAPADSLRAKAAEPSADRAPTNSISRKAAPAAVMPESFEAPPPVAEAWTRGEMPPADLPAGDAPAGDALAGALDSVSPRTGDSSTSTFVSYADVGKAAQASAAAGPAGQPDRTDHEAEAPHDGRRATRKDTVPQTHLAEPAAPGGEQEALWRTVGAGRIGLAYHIAKLRRAAGASEAHPTPELLEALALGMALRGPDDDLAVAYAQRVGPLSGLDFEACDAPLRDALNLILFAASLRPALFSSQRDASIRVLGRVDPRGRLSAVRSLARAMAECAEKLQGRQLDLVTLEATLAGGLWGDWIDEHRERVARWRTDAASASFIGPARAVWQRWLRSSAVLGELSRLVTNGTVADVPRVREIVSDLRDPKAVRTLVEHTHRSLGRHGDSIVGGALRQLERHLGEPCDLADRWLRIMDTGPVGGRRLEGDVERLRDRVNTLGPPALEAVTRLQRTGAGTPLDSALVCAGATIEFLHGLFQGGGDPDRPQNPETVRQALRDDLLFVTAIRVDQSGQIDGSMASEEVLALLTDTDAHAVDLPAAFDKRLGRGDLQGAHAVCERMGAEDDHVAAYEAKVRLTEAVRQRRESLEGRVHELVGWLEQAFIAGELEESARAEMTGALDDMQRRLEEDVGVLAADKAVASVAETVEPAIERAVKQVNDELREFLPRNDVEEQALIDDALDARDVATLREQRDWLRDGQPIRALARDDCAHLRSFLEAADRVEAEPASDAGHYEVVRAVGNRQDVFGLTFSDLDVDQSKRAAKLLECWFGMVRAGSADRDALDGLFTSFGFNLKNPGVEVRGDATAVLRTDPLRVPAVCPDHTFGSDADGRYDVLLSRSSTARESVMQTVAAADSRRQTIVLHLGRLTLADREELRRWSIDDAIPFITIDETLVLYLASLSEGILRALFDCTLPFTCTRPYFTAAGLVPPEAFFGREGERGKVRDRYGSCFVYGGRQLGKTALLRHVRADFHRPAQGHLAEYIDLKARDVGVAEGPQHLWQVLWGALKDLRVVDDGTPMPRRSTLMDNVESAVGTWLDEGQDRRLLVLLDEADAFLAADLKDDFRVSTRLKALMDRTERRFKVILCGLHNVLRNTERSNHPLAHFGDPVCVGPLLENGDLRQARALVRNPLAAVGYTFQSENLVTRILLWTNYYPSLIQVFCEALLDHLRQVPGRRLLDPIADEEVRRVFGRPELRDRIRGLFSLTLGLDQRYEVVAYAMAWELLHNERNPADGLPRRQIFALARYHWEEGFRIPEREFDTLLLEMCGLGVLRQRADTHFAFRNLNVLHLLGDDDTIEAVLDKQREAPVLFSAPVWHARFPNARPESRRRGPLTYHQESRLNEGGRVAVVSGTAAAGVDDLLEFLKGRMGSDRVLPLEPTTDGRELARQINRLRPDRSDRATVLRLVSDRSPWSLPWIEDAATALRTAQRGRSVRVVFRADPKRLWDLVEDLPAERLDPAADEYFDWMVVGPWAEVFVRQWCSEHELYEANSKIRELFNLTGGWPSLLERYASTSETTWRARADALHAHIERDRANLLALFGLGAADVRRELAPLLAWNSSLRADDVDTYAELWAEEHPPIEAGVLRRRLFWATQLGLIDNDIGAGAFNPLVARLLSDDGE